MIDLTMFKGQKFAIFGLGKSGLSTASALNKAGAITYLWDDHEQSRINAIDLGFELTDLNGFDFSDLAGLVLSPGVPLTHPKAHWTVDKAKAVNIPILGDVELFLQAAKLFGAVKIIAVTGTNGKSTTVSLIHHILKQAGLDVHLGGNIGTTAVMDMAALSSGRIYVIELSSYQIDLMPSLQKKGFAPDIAVLINVSADHIERHGTIEHYADVKSQIFKMQRHRECGIKDDAGIKECSEIKGDLAIIGVDDVYGQKFAKQYAKLTPTRISTLHDIGDILYQNGKLYKNGKILLDMQQFAKLQGPHNGQNAAISYEIAKYFDIKDEAIKRYMRDFEGLEHRMALVGKIEHEKGAILFVNDSKATNAEAVKPALNAYQNIYWLAGGTAKAGGVKILVNDLTNVKKAYLFGQSAANFAKDLINVTKYEIFNDINAAINKAITDIVHSDIVGQKVILLSPAAASFDQFDNFEQRGEQFKALAKKLGAS